LLIWSSLALSNSSTNDYMPSLFGLNILSEVCCLFGSSFALLLMSKLFKKF